MTSLILVIKSLKRSKIMPVIIDTYICCFSIFKNAAINIKFRTVWNSGEGGEWNNRR